MRVVIAQFNSKLGDIQGNSQRIIEVVKASTVQPVDLIVFPELALTGYPPRDLLDIPGFVDSNLAALEKIASQVPPSTSVILGYVDKNDGSGKPFRNAAALLGNGKVKARCFKQLLPYYGVFEDERYFEPGNASAVWTVAGKKVGVTICEDAWNEPGFLPCSYPVDPVQNLQSQKLDLLVNLSASPFHLGKPAVRQKLFSKVVEKVGAPVVYCNQVAAHDDLIFDGMSFCLSKSGELLAQAQAFSSEVVEIDLASPSAFSGKKTAASWDEAEWVRRALVFGIKDYCQKSGIQKAVLGLSGGIDSAVVVCLAAEALGAKNVFAVSLPSRHSSAQTRADAKTLAANLGVGFEEIPMDSVYEGYRSLLSPMIALENSLIDENLQPRIRMVILMAFSQKHGAVLLNTSNKSEIACGYATLYGDTAGALAVLGDLTKARVYALARHYNLGKTVIPESIITRAPSAELRPNQKDQDSLPAYDLLDHWVTEAVERGTTEKALIEKSPEHRTEIEKFFRLYRISEFKRFQTPPVLRVTPRAFGRGRRIPLASSKPF